MALRAIFTAVGVVTDVVQPAVNGPINGTPWYLNSTNNNSYMGTYTRDVDGYLLMTTKATGSSTVGKALFASAPLSDLIPSMSSQKVIIGGGRWRSPNNLITNVFSFSGPMSASGIPANSAQVLNVFKVTDFTFVANTPRYFEWELNFPAGFIYRWIDGVALDPLAIPAWMVTLADIVDGTGLRFGWGTPATISILSSSNMIQGIRDGYLLERTVDGIDSVRKGPQVVNICPVKEVSVSDDWTPSAGTIIDALNTPITTAASRLTPMVTSGLLEKPLQVKFDASALNANKINAATVVFMAKRLPGTDSASQVTIKDGATTLGSRTMALPVDDIVTNLPGLTFSKDGSGAALNKTKLESLVLTVQPVSGA